MLTSDRRKRKRVRKQTDFFNPEKQRGLARTEKKGNKCRFPSKRNIRAGAPPTISRSASSSVLEGRTARPCGGYVTPRKKQRIEPNECGEQANVSLESDSEGNRMNFSALGNLQNMLVEAVNSGNGDHNCERVTPRRRRRRRHHSGSISQVLGEDILCDAGLAFLLPGVDSDDEIDRDAMLHKFADRPGITRNQPSAKKSIRSAMNGSSNVPSTGSVAKHVRYRSRITYEGASINLGNHASSAAAVAMQDLATLSLFGSDHSKTMQILSKDEAWVGLKAAKLPTALPSYGRVEPFRSQFTEQYKPVFEQQIEDALASIGGQDDFLADVLSTLDLESYRQAKILDAAEEAKRAKARKKEEKKRAREDQRAEKLAKKLKKRQKSNSLSNDINSPIFCDEHGTYGVDGGGRYFWCPGRVRKMHHDGSEPAMQQTPNESKTSGRIRGLLETDSDTSPNSDVSFESTEKPRFSSMPGDNEVPVMEFKTSNRPSESRGPSPTLSEQRRSRVRILSFDSCSTCSSVEDAADTKMSKKADSSWSLRDVFSSDDIEDKSSSSRVHPLKEKSAPTSHQNSFHAPAPQQVSFMSNISIFDPNVVDNELLPVRLTNEENKRRDSSEASGIPEAITVASAANQVRTSHAEAYSGRLPPSLVSSESVGSEQVAGTMLSSKEIPAQHTDANNQNEEARRCVAKEKVSDKPSVGNDIAQPFAPFVLPNFREREVFYGNERLKPALEILQNFAITPLLSSQAPDGVKVASKGDAGKVLTGLRFKSRIIGQANASQPVNLSDQEFVIDVGVGEGNVPVLKLRSKPNEASETLTVQNNLAARVACTMLNGEIELVDPSSSQSRSPHHGYKTASISHEECKSKANNKRQTSEGKTVEPTGGNHCGK